MWYAIISEDVENSLPLRVKAREAHLARMQELVTENRVLIAGPHPAVDSEDSGSAGFTGSLVVIDFPSLEEAKAWANDDPYVAAGVYAHLALRVVLLVWPVR